MRTLFASALAALAVACSHAEERKDPKADTRPAPAAGAATTGADPAAADEGPCASDADCGFTRVAPGACCPLLCVPRVVTKQRAEELSANVAVCHKGQECPVPPCRPPRFEQKAVCEQARCVARSTPLPE